ncbi:MAG: Bug family tripartite tricarboxylate transporter substrate binding protein [Burkholderiales bacterium]
MLRSPLQVSLAGALLLCAATPAFAQIAAGGYPNRTIRFVVGFAPGGSTDIVARLIAQELGKNIGQQVVVDNRTGAGGIIATEVLAKSPPDGYTILACTTGTFAIQPFMFSKLPYNVEKDIVPVTQTGSLPYIIVVHPSLPVKNVKEFIAFAKPRPGQLNYASSGVGTGSHLSAAYFNNAAGINVTHVPYKGTGQAMGDLLGGQVVMMMDQVVSSLPHVKAGKLKMLGISSSKRFPTLPDVPTIAESGVPGFDAVSWSGVCVPGGTSRDIVNKLQQEIAKVLQAPDLKTRFLNDGIEPIGSTPEQFTEHTKKEAVKWGKVVKDTGAKAD